MNQRLLEHLVQLQLLLAGLQAQRLHKACLLHAQVLNKACLLLPQMLSKTCLLLA